MTEAEQVRVYRNLRLDPRQPASAVRSVYASQCLSCGVCCAYYAQNPFHIDLNEADTPPPKLVQIGPRHTGRGGDGWNDNRYMRTVDLKAKDFFGWKGFKKCIAFEGTMGKEVRCGIYEQRPRACSEYDPGSPGCLNARRWAGMPPPEDIMALGRS